MADTYVAHYVGILWGSYLRRRFSSFELSSGCVVWSDTEIRPRISSDRRIIVDLRNWLSCFCSTLLRMYILGGNLRFAIHMKKRGPPFSHCGDSQPVFYLIGLIYFHFFLTYLLTYEGCGRF